MRKCSFFKSLAMPLMSLQLEYCNVCIGGFHVTSCQANFASHHTHNRHVGFLFMCEGIGKSNKMFHNFSFSSFHITKSQPNDKNISTHTRMKFQIFP